MITTALIMLMAFGLLSLVLCGVGMVVGGDTTGDGCAIAMFGCGGAVAFALSIIALVKVYQ